MKWTIPLLLCVGCITPGKQRVLGFTIRDDAGVLGFGIVDAQNKIAVGGEVDLLVYVPNEGPRFRDDWWEPSTTEGTSLPVESASSSRNDILDVNVTADGHVRLRGVSAGLSTLTVKTARGSDQIDLQVADVAKIDLYVEYQVPVDLYARGSLLLVRVLPKDAQGNNVVGYHPERLFAALPGITFLTGPADTDLMAVRFETEGPARLEPRIGDPLLLAVVEPTDDVTLELRFWRPYEKTDEVAADSLEVGGGVAAIPAATLTDGRRLSVVGLATVTSKTPDVCTTSPGPSWVAGRTIVLGLAVGTCDLEIAFGATTQMVSVPVVEKPKTN